MMAWLDVPGNAALAGLGLVAVAWLLIIRKWI